MAELGVLTSLCIFCITYAVIQTDHYTLKPKLVLMQTRSSIMCMKSSLIICAVKCSSTTNCIKFCMERTKTCYRQVSFPLPPRLTTFKGSRALVECNTYIGLYTASEKGQLQTIKKIVSQGLEHINCRGRYGRTLLMAAAKNGQMAVFDYLIKQGADMSGVDDATANILHIACLGGFSKIVKRILEQNLAGIGIESRGDDGWTPVFYAVRQDNIRVVKFLVKEGCNLKTRDDDNDSILHVACIDRSVELVNYILHQRIPGVDIESKGQKGRTPVLVAARYGNIRVVKFLMRDECDLEAIVENNNVLHVACMNDNAAMVEYILKLNLPGIGVESKGKSGRTAVLTAARHGNVKVAKFLVKKRCNLKALDADKNNILHVACIGCYLDMVKYILKKKIAGVGIDSIGDYGWSPIFVAIRNCDNNKLIKYLVQRGCNMKIIDNDKDSILHAACLYDSVDMMKYILKQNIPGIDARGHHGWTPVVKATRYNKIGVVKYLVSKGCNLKVLDDDNNNILHVACISGSVNMVKYILKQNIPGVNIDSKGSNGSTPVMIAARNHHIHLADI